MRYETEIVVCGAGTAGSVAAIAAADAGRDVLVIEQFGSAGGSGTLALVTPLMNTCVPGNPMGSYVSREINRRMVALGAAAAIALPAQHSSMKAMSRRLGSTLWPNTRMSVPKHTPMA